jgi:hypothetical protein
LPFGTNCMRSPLRDDAMSSAAAMM